MKPIRLLQYIWCIPNTIIGLILFVLYCPIDIRWRNGCLEATTWTMFPWWTKVAGQTWGWLVIYRVAEPSIGLQRHERQHVLQGLCMGPAFLFFYVAQCFVALFRGRRFYRDNWFERNADHARENGVGLPELEP